ncbi:glucan endo-1,3-beta-glucosidase 3-like [Asparagus officinalis]|uniref:glucan endo-1,3-beta-glucosidase 3-like n=1 Tax=Asparagus officinalis TaxID=4686 RepID=UPI00098E3CC8|nr:glucan endo-1,3-beta-glucosidase 3-like [Asparagus officinalis]
MSLLVLLLLMVSVASAADDGAFIGVNIGTALSDMPSPTQVVALLKKQQIQHVRLYDADIAMLTAFANSGIRVTVSVPNEQLLGIGQSNATAANWVSRNVVAHVPAVNITAIAVGSEVLTALPNAAPVLVSALKFIHSALVAANLDRQVKVSTPHSSSIILDSFPPSQAFFNRSLDPVIVPMLKFLQSTGSYLMLNVYPYYDYMQSNGVIPLDYALFRPLPPNKEAVDANTLLHYTNVFDAVVDAAYFAMAYLNITNVPVTVLESGWPRKGDSNEPDATVDNANTYNSNLIRHVLNTTGTPKHPGIAVNTYIYELYDEDLRPGALSEKFWGLFDANGVPVYTLHLMGSGMVLANDTTNNTYCIAKDGVDEKMLQAALDWACGPGKVDCSELLQGQPCYDPDTVEAHATYAFNAYYHQMGMGAGTCDFNGVAAITTTDPSHGPCKFPGSGGKNGKFGNGTSLAPSANSTSDVSGFDPYYFSGKSLIQVIGMLLPSLFFL